MAKVLDYGRDQLAYGWRCSYRDDFGFRWTRRETSELEVRVWKKRSMAAGLQVRVPVGAPEALLHRPVEDQFSLVPNHFGAPRPFAVPPLQSSAWPRLEALRKAAVLPSWHGRKDLVPLSVAINDSVAAAGFTTDEPSSGDIERPKPELDSLGEFQEPHLSGDPSRVHSSGDDQPILRGEGESPIPAENERWTVVKKKLAGIISNAQKQSQGVHHIRHSLGVDLGDSRTGVAISLKGYAPRPLSVLQLKGDKLIENLLQIASRERADEFIVGLPLSFDGKETSQSNKTQSFARKLATQAAQRGWRVYLLDEYGSSQDGLNYMLDIGIKKKSRKEKLDAYAALVLLHSYFRSKGALVKLVIPKGLSLQERLCLGDDSAIDEFNIEDGL